MQDTIEQTTIRKVTWRLIPFLLLLYFIAYLDRVNVGFAALQMNQDLGFSASVYGLGAGVFFAGYALCEVPSNLILSRVGARRWIARIMFTWGLISIGMIFTRGPLSFYILRFLLGVAEAGFLPGIIYYLGDWYPAPQRAKAVGWFMSAIPLSIVIGGPLAGFLLDLDHLLGLRGWQWLFLLEGVPAVLLSFITLFYLTDHPNQARWLNTEQQQWLSETIRAEQNQARERHGLGLGRALLHPTVWLLALLSMLCQSGSYGLSLWIPQIVKTLSGYSDFQVGMITALPYCAAAIGMVVVGASSDRTNERFLHIAVPSMLAVIGFSLSAWLTSPLPAIIALTIAAVGDLSSRGPFWALPSRFLSGSASAGGIALINTIGSLGGFVGPAAVGWIKDRTGNYSDGLLFLAALLFAGVILTLYLRRVPMLTDSANDS